MTFPLNYTIINRDRNHSWFLRQMCKELKDYLFSLYFDESYTNVLYHIGDIKNGETSEILAEMTNRTGVIAMLPQPYVTVAGTKVENLNVVLDLTKEWQDLDPEDRPSNFIPKKHDSLRSVAGYDRFIQERFERCLDLYLCPRMKKKKVTLVYF